MVHEVQRLPYTNIIINSKPLPGVNFPETISPIEFNILAEQIVEHRKNEIEKLKIIGFCGNFFEEFLPYFQNLSQLYLFEVKLELSNGYPYERVNLPNLKILEIEQSHKILEMFKANNLKKFSVLGYSNDFDENFLQYSTKLEILVIFYFNVNYFNYSSLLDLKLKVLELNFGSSHGVPMRSYRRCGNSRLKPIGTGTVNFLLTQKDNLNELSINLDEGNSGIIVEFCLKELKNFTKFSLKTQDNFYINSDKICVNESVKELEINSKFDQGVKTLMSCCPSTTSLTFNINGNLNVNILEHISISMQNLKTLQICINSLKHDIFANTNFENLEMLKNTNFENFEKLKLSGLNSDSDYIWHKIALVCPNLKELSLNYKNIEILPQKLDNVLEKCEKLEILSFNADLNIFAVLGFIELMSYKPANLKRINFSAKYYNDYFYKVINYLTRETNIKVYIKNN